MAREIVNRQLNIYINSGDAQKAFDVLAEKAGQLGKRLAEATNPKEIAKLKSELAKLAEPIDRARKKLSGELLPTFKDLEAATRKWLNEFKRTGDPAALANYQKFNNTLQEQKKIINGLTTAQKSFGLGSIFAGATLANLATEGLSKIKQLLGGSIKEFEQADLAIKNLANSLENFGAIEALPTLSKQADDLAKKFSFLDNDDITEAQDKLVTFGKLTTKEIEKLIPVIVDYAAKTGKQIPEATDVFIKALQGAAKGIKTFGVEVKDTNGIAKNFSLLTTELAQKVRGAADTFGSSATGKIASFRQAINNIKESLGRLIAKIAEGKKSADDLFDEAKKETEQYNDSLDPLLKKYDELKGKTTLNKDEQTLLQGIIAKIVEIVPQAATEFDKYGNALDINKRKVIDFRKENDKFLQQREKSAIDEVTAAAEKQVGVLNMLIDNRKRLVSEHEKYAATEESTNRVLSIQDEAIAKAKQKIIDITDVLINKYKITLPAALQATRDAALAAKFAIEKVGETLTEGDKKVLENRKTEETPEQKAERERAEREAKARAKKIVDDFKKLKDELRKLANEDINNTALDKEVISLNEKFEQLKLLAHGNRQKLKEIDTAYYRELFEIQVKYSRLELDEFERKEKEKEKRSQEIIKRLISVGLQTSTRDTLGKAMSQQARKEIAALNLDVLKATPGSRKQLDAELAQLDDQRNRELANTKLTEIEKDEIREKFRQARAQKEQDFEKAQLDLWLQNAQAALNIFNLFSQARTDKENQELENDRQRNEKKKQNLERRLQKGLLTQLQYDREVQKIEKEQEKREKEVRLKQFKRNQRAQVVQAIMNGAMAITSTLAAIPGPLDILTLGAARIVQLALMAATTAAQVAIIAKQKPPEFARGGKLGGAYHSEGGNPILDGRTGHKIAEIEKGELIVNKKTAADKNQYSVSGNPSQIISRLNHLHGGVSWDSGGRLMPKWYTAKPVPMNFPAIKKYYAAGGKFQGQENNSPTNATDSNKIIQDLTAVVNNMQQTLDNIQRNGIAAYTLLSQHEKQQARLDAIRNDATMK